MTRECEDCGMTTGGYTDEDHRCDLDEVRRRALAQLEKRAARAEAEVVRLRAALEKANDMVVRHTMPYGWPEFAKSLELRDYREILNIKQAAELCTDKDCFLPDTHEGPCAYQLPELPELPETKP